MRSSTGFERAILHPEVSVRAGPWTSTIGFLSNSGYRFDLMEDVRSMYYRVGIRNPTKGLVAWCAIPYDAMREWQVVNNLLYFPDNMSLTSHHIAEEVRIPNYISRELTMEVGVPAMPLHLMNGRDNEWVTYTPDGGKKVDEIIVTSEKIPMLLDEIRKAQEPEARELLHNQQQREELRSLELKAQILTFG